MKINRLAIVTVFFALLAWFTASELLFVPLQYGKWALTKGFFSVSFCSYLIVTAGVLSLGLGAIKKINKSDGREKGKIMVYITMILFVFYFILWVIALVGSYFGIYDIV